MGNSDDLRNESIRMLVAGDTVGFNKRHRSWLNSHADGSLDLGGLSLKGVNLQGAFLQLVDFRGADLEGANLRDSDCRGSDFRGANLRNTDWRGAALENANLQGVVLDGACNFVHATIDDRTVLPEGYFHSDFQVVIPGDGTSWLESWIRSKRKGPDPDNFHER